MAASPYSAVRQRRERRHMRLVALGYRNYPEYLKSPHWQQVKAHYRASDRPQRCICGEEEGLPLHHLTYERIGEELLTDLHPLCGRCHQIIHVLEARGDISLDMAGLQSPERAARYAVELAPRIERARGEFECTTAPAVGAPQLRFQDTNAQAA